MTTPDTQPSPDLQRMDYYARVKNSSGMHTVFYGKVCPEVGAECDGVATPNKITGYWLRPVDWSQKSEPSGN